MSAYYTTAQQRSEPSTRAWTVLLSGPYASKAAADEHLTEDTFRCEVRGIALEPGSVCTCQVVGSVATMPLLGGAS
jgi:hypothetical protein